MPGDGGCGPLPSVEDIGTEAVQPWRPGVAQVRQREDVLDAGQQAEVVVEPVRAGAAPDLRGEHQGADPAAGGAAGDAGGGPVALPSASSKVMTSMPSCLNAGESMIIGTCCFSQASALTSPPGCRRRRAQSCPSLHRFGVM